MSQIHGIESYREKILALIPENIRYQLLRLENLERSGEIGPADKIAAFDMDGTLIDGDIGEAAFFMLRSLGYEFEFSWTEYLELLEKGQHSDDYAKIVTTMKGLPIGTVENATLKMFEMHEKEITITENGREYSFPLPVRSEVMNYIVTYLKISGFTVFVISASNFVSVRAIAKEWYGIPQENVLAVKTEIVVDDQYRDYFTDKIAGIMTYGEGKVDALRQRIGDMPPLIAAGDTEGDLPLLNLVHPSGSVILCGTAPEKIEALHSKLNRRENSAYFLHGG